MLVVSRPCHLEQTKPIFIQFELHGSVRKDIHVITNSRKNTINETRTSLTVEGSLNYYSSRWYTPYIYCILHMGSYPKLFGSFHKPDSDR